MKQCKSVEFVKFLNVKHTYSRLAAWAVSMQWMVACIGAGAGIFLGLLTIFSRISPNLPKSLQAILGANISSHTDHEHLLGCPPIKDLGVILYSLRANFSKSNDVGRFFARISRLFSYIFRHFANIFINFAQIFIHLA